MKPGLIRRLRPRVPLLRGRLLYRYVALLVSVTCTVLLLSGLINMWMSYDSQKAAMLRLQQEQARAGAARISAYLREIETHLRGLVQSSWSFSTNEDRRVDGIRLMNLLPAVNELAIIAPSGREQVRLSRLGPDAMASGVDR